MKLSFVGTRNACFAGYIVQAIINTFAPLLFLTFESEYQIPLSKITLLVTVNFGIQLVVDLLAVGVVDRIGYRVSAVVAHIIAAFGLLAMAFLPSWLKDPYMGLMTAVCLYAVGGGLIEVLISPIMESCPNEQKKQAMSLLHSFYCWGQVAVILCSTLFFLVIGISNWKLLAVIWAAFPLLNAVFFCFVPLAPLLKAEETGLKVGQLLQKKEFWLMVLLMACAGACEQSVSQWASAFAERGLGISKTAGDLAGPMLFAVLMGTSRAVYGKFGAKINLERFMFWSGLLCVVSYLLIALTPYPIFGLIGCGLCGLSVGILWPGTYSIAAAKLRTGGTALFAFLALAGDLGCAFGPTFVGVISGLWEDDLQVGILSALIFPILLLLGLIGYRQMTRRSRFAQGKE